MYTCKEIIEQLLPNNMGKSTINLLSKKLEGEYFLGGIRLSDSGSHFATWHFRLRISEKQLTEEDAFLGSCKWGKMECISGKISEPYQWIFEIFHGSH